MLSLALVPISVSILPRTLIFASSYSSGFRAPQAFDEDLHIENVGGTVSMIERAKNLKEEKSQSFSASADMYHRFGAFQVNFLVEGFYTRLSDVFVLENIGERDGILIKERRNGSGAKVLGLSMEGKMAYLSLFQLQQESPCNRAVMTNRKSEAKRHRPRRRFSVHRIPMDTLRQRIRRSSLSHYPCRARTPARCWCSTWPVISTRMWR